MVMPLNYLLVRHGESYGNLAVHAAENGDESYYTEQFVMIPGIKWELTENGKQQAAAIGQFIQGLMPVQTFFVSPYIRTRMTAAGLGIADAEWKMNRAYREREWGDIENIPRSVFEKEYPHSSRQKTINPLYWCPPGGESIADIAENRVANILSTLNSRSYENVLAVTHGENILAHRLRLEWWSDEEFEQNIKKDDYKIKNCQLFWYSRVNPATGEILPKLQWMRSFAPVPVLDVDGNITEYVVQERIPWRRFSRPRFTNEELLNTIS